MIGEIFKSAGKEVNAASDANKHEHKIDIGKRLDVNNHADDEGKKVDISKRISPESNKDISRKEIKQLASHYISELKEKSDYPETIKKIDISKLEVQDPETVLKRREEFDSSKKKLIAEWEAKNGKEWPTYTKDVTNADGVIIRHAGERYDAHHIQPLKLGGLNEASNITPLDCNKHKEIHSSSGCCKKLMDKMEGK